MRTQILFLCIFLFSASYAQVEKVDNAEYFMYFKPVVGSLKGSSDITQKVNPDLSLQSKGLLYGIDWVSGRWAYVDNDYLVPRVQVPIRVRYMKAGDKGLSLSDDTTFPSITTSSDSKKDAPFSYFDLSIDMYLSPYYIKAGSVVITPKFGLGVDVASHAYDMDMTRFVGKTGTNPDLDNMLAGATLKDYSYSFWEDLYGINLGSYANVSQRLFIDFGWEYYPVRLIGKMAGNSINAIWNANPGTYKSSSSKLRRYNLEVQYRVASWFSVFTKYENSKYQYNGQIILGNSAFYQKYSNLMFGITLGGPKL